MSITFLATNVRHRVGYSMPAPHHVLTRCGRRAVWGRRTGSAYEQAVYPQGQATECQRCWS